MRLKSIKLAGFKSFVESTTVIFPSELIGVVGPNGCGKSNIIDAVRWVMGESSAKYLRTESMADVIFNGSSQRQPLGYASVELDFDNTDGKIGGEYAKYAEISIRREVSRDGQSDYFLNGTRCRRRDIADVFLGTGLGSRSYSIIGQGTISNLIEAKPEDLRVYLEEAAGISKYKERRRETENRIKHTRENLDRLSDLRDELGKQLQRLERQSKAAAKYQEFKSTERTLRQQLLAMRAKRFTEQSDQIEQNLRQFQVQYEAYMAKVRGYDAEIEQSREKHTELTESFNLIQGRFYSLGTDIARVEQSIEHNRQRHQQLESDIAESTQSLQEIDENLLQENSQIEKLTLDIETLTPEVERLKSVVLKSTEDLQHAEEAMREWQIGWDEFNQHASKVSNQAEVEQTKIQHLEQRIQATKERSVKLQAEFDQLDGTALTEEITEIGQQAKANQEKNASVKSALSTVAVKITEQREKNQLKSRELDQLRKELQTGHGRRASLEALQQAALGKSNEIISHWLLKNNLQDSKRLAQILDVESGWEQAVEIVLGAYLEAVCVDNLPVIEPIISTLEKGALAFIELTNSSNPVAAISALTPLLLKIRSTHIPSVLTGIYVTDTLGEALSHVKQLQPGESIVTRDGLWLGQNWLRVARDVDPKQGVLAREREIKSLSNEIAQVQEQITAEEFLLQEGQQELAALEKSREEIQHELSEVAGKDAHLAAQLRVKQSRLDQLQQRCNQITQDLSELDGTLTAAQGDLANSRMSWQSAMSVMEEHAGKRDQLIAKRDSLQQHLASIRQCAARDKEASHQTELRLGSGKTLLNSLSQNQVRLVKQKENLVTRSQMLANSLAEVIAPQESLKHELAGFLDKRVDIDQELGQARTSLQNNEHGLRQLEDERIEADEKARETHQATEELRLEKHGLSVRRETTLEQLTEVGGECSEILNSLPEDAVEANWESELTTIEQKIQRLGPINLAAINEFETESERKRYLDQQNDDLTEALTTLENAIRKIDRETRHRFKETYDFVNNGFQTLFPTVFGGGNAYIELTGEDLLDTGVRVIARPPGKKNSTIHMLSGGEKALTALALVFAIFQLNPAPFCMLDEVDAPLDDANVMRFCHLVKTMSATVQFIFITHNKVTMEMAKQLIGVTMNEPGVSRLVTVDIAEAVNMVEEAV